MAVDVVGGWADERLDYFLEVRGKAALWFAVLSGPTAWFLDLMVSYGLVHHLCRTGTSWPLHLASAAMMALAVTGVAVAWRSYGRIRGLDEIHASPVAGRSRLMALGGLGLAGFFSVIIFLAWLPALVLDPCAGTI